MNSGVQRHFFAPSPGALESFNFNYKVNLKDFLYQTFCVFSQMKDTKYIRQDFHSRGGARGAEGSKIKFRPCLSVMLSPPKPLNQLQIWCVNWGVQRQNLTRPPGALERSQKVKYH